MSIKTTIYGLIFGSLVFATGCPEDNNDPSANNPNSEDMSNDQTDMPVDRVDMSNDMPGDMPDMESDGADDMATIKKATACVWMRTRPATLPLEETPQDVTVVFGCDGVIEDNIIFARDGADGELESVTCKAGEANGPAQQCEVLIKGITPVSADGSAGPENLVVTIPDLEAIDTTLRWHHTLAQLEDQASAIETYNAPKSLGSKGLGFNLKALDKDTATFFGVHAHEVLIEKDLEKQRQEILKNLEFEFGTVTNTGAMPTEPTVQAVNLGAGQLMYQRSAMARTSKGFEALWWGQVNDAADNANFVGVLFELDTKGQPTGPGITLNVPPQVDPIKTIVSSQLYNLKEIGVDKLEGYAAATLHTTRSGKWQLTAGFSGDDRRGVEQSKLMDSFGGVLAKDVEEGSAWAGLLPRPIQFDPKDASFLPIGWAAQPSAQGIAFSIVDASSTVGELEDTVQFVTTFEVKNVHVGVTDKFTITVLLAGDDQQVIYTIKTDGNKIQPPTELELPLLSDYTPLPASPTASVFGLSDEDDKDIWLEPIEDDDGQILLRGRPSTKVQRRLRIRRRIRKRIAGSPSHTTFWNGDGTHVQTTSLRAEVRPEFGVGKVSHITGSNTSAWACEDACLKQESGDESCGKTDHFRPLVTAPNGTAVGLVDGETVGLAVQKGDGGTPQALTLPNTSKKDPEVPLMALLEGEEVVMMPYKAPSSVDTLAANAVAIWFIDEQGTPSNPALVNFGAEIDHATMRIAGMGTEVLVFFRAADGTTGNVSVVPVADLEALIGDTEAIASYDLSKNAVSLGALAPDGPDVELLTNNTLSTPFDRTTGPSTITDFIAATDFVIAYTGEGCGDPKAMTFDSPPDAESTPLLPFEIRSDDFCPDVGGGIVARGDFLGTGSEQVVLFDGETFSLVHTTIKEFQIPEKVVMEKEDDFYGLTLPPTGVVNTVAQGDYNGDGLMDLAIDTSEGVLIAFSDGNGGTLSVSGTVPGLSAIVDTFGPPTYKFGSRTKKSTTTTRSRPQLQ